MGHGARTLLLVATAALTGVATMSLPRVAAAESGGIFGAIFLLVGGTSADGAAPVSAYADQPGSLFGTPGAQAPIDIVPGGET